MKCHMPCVCISRLARGLAAFMMTGCTGPSFSDAGAPSPPETDGSTPSFETDGSGSEDGSSGVADGDPDASSCGDGVVDFGERCDDGNDFEGDACNRHCVTPGSKEWTWEHDALFGVDMRPGGILYTVEFEGAETTFAAYDVDLEQRDRAVFVNGGAWKPRQPRATAQQLAVSSTGPAAWVYPVTPAAGSDRAFDDGVRLRIIDGPETLLRETFAGARTARVVASADGFYVGIVAVGGAEYLHCYGLDGALRWRIEENISVGQLLLSSDDWLIAGGQTVSAVDLERGTVAWSMPWPHARGTDALALSKSGTLRAMGRDDLPFATRLTIDFDLEGRELARVEWPERGVAEARAAAFDGEGHLFVLDGALSKLDDALDPLWTVLDVDADSAFPQPNGTVVVASVGGISWHAR